jgi:GNAT superfamily N-acetyltransferase
MKSKNPKSNVDFYSVFSPGTKRTHLYRTYRTNSCTQLRSRPPHGRTVVALCHIYARPALDKPPEAVVQALVVDQASRGTGVGRIMMAAAEAWAADRGFTSVALASHISRAQAHAFYAAIGYKQSATSHLFRKTLERDRLRLTSTSNDRALKQTS